jgi:hypothetical protein
MPNAVLVWPLDAPRHTPKVDTMPDHTIDASALFPGLGYFGATNSDCINIPLNERIQGIRIYIPEGAVSNLLNLKKLEIHNPEGLIKLSDDEVNLSQSSTYNGDAKFGPKNLLQGRGIHTQSEREPSWQALFSQPIDITQLRLYNRGDRWGVRARNAVIQVQIGQRWTEIRNPTSGQHFWSTLQKCAEVAGPINLCSDAATLRHRLLRAISATLTSPTTALESVPWDSILGLINMWGDSALDDQELTLVAAWMTQVGGLPPLMPMAGKLATPESILHLQDRINHLANIHGIGHFVVSRHGVQHSYLLSNREAFLTGVEKLVCRLHGLDYQAMLAYGTLLGAVRDQSLIAHDDDLDLLMLCQARDQESAALEMTQVADQLRKAGYCVDQMLPQSLNMHVRDPELDVELDLFPCWRGNDGLVHLHMEKMAIRAIPENIIHPAGTVTLHGRSMPAPANPPAFLLERYGPTWTTPDQFFEWPWPLSSTNG